MLQNVCDEKLGRVEVCYVELWRDMEGPPQKRSFVTLNHGFVTLQRHLTCCVVRGGLGELYSMILA
jgi:hypothetical protein